MTIATRVTAVLLVGLALLAFIGSDAWFAVFDDESEFVTLARQPLSQTVDDYLIRDGQPQHAPLAGVLLHEWLPIGGFARWSLRLPSVILYLAGLVGFALVAARLAGETAFVSLLWIGVLWPLGFHYGRLADWYSWCFFLVAAVTLAYLRYIERTSGLRLAAFLMAAALLVYSTYYGWAIVGCLVIDFALIRRPPDSLKFAVITLGALALCYLPLWRVFGDEVYWGVISSAEKFDAAWTPFRALNALYNFYVLFVSESVAPWFWYASIPLSIGIAASVVLMWSLLQPDHRRYFIYFALLFGGMIIMDIISARRLLHICGWLLLAFALALANTEKPIRRRLLALLLASVGAVGWGGILTRDYYASPHFIEPWDAIAASAANIVKAGGAIVTNSTPFLFSMNYALARLKLVKPSAVPGWVVHPAIVSVAEWSAIKRAHKSPILLVGEGQVGANIETARVKGWLETNCVALRAGLLVPDTGYALKRKFYPDAVNQHFRIKLWKYNCPRAATR